MVETTWGRVLNLEQFRTTGAIDQIHTTVVELSQRVVGDGAADQIACRGRCHRKAELVGNGLAGVGDAEDQLALAQTAW